jgi:hypothetical protein
VELPEHTVRLALEDQPKEYLPQTEGKEKNVSQTLKNNKTHEVQIQQGGSFPKFGAGSLMGRWGMETR